MIIQNAVFIPTTNEYLCSKHRHDFRSTKVNNNIIAVDGGLDYCRRVGDPTLMEDFSLDSNSTEEEIRDKLLWGVWTDEKTKYFPVKKLTLDHLMNILKNVDNVNGLHEETIKYWIERKKQKI